MRFVLHGGLGNLLIQFAAANKMADLNNEKIDFFTSYVKKREPHEILAYKELKDIYNVEIVSGTTSFFNELYYKLLEKICPSMLGDETECNFKKSPKIIKGYFQNSFFWSFGAKEIMEYIDLGKLIKKVPQYDMVVHLRGGDYLKSENSSIHRTLDRSVIERFVDVCKESSGDDNLRLTIVTDDAYFANELLDGLDIDVISTKDILYDFSILACSKYLLTSQSSFSVLAGLYSNSNSGHVFSPKNIGDSFDFDYFELPWEYL